ncbi:hypothetical protein DSM112329_01058 [Paraconexibacter sp. AEG42_29]|uniref:GH26 domain-containing protein n=1 Tax=Paraconexibacter sp. AEG42_29 TaxID=2997339 RepID=A0AAU7ARL3_9ACTN
MRTPRPLLLLLLLLTALTAAAPAAHASVPAGWPSDRLVLGARDEENGAGILRDATRLTARYHYLSGGSNTGAGWSKWTMGGGSFVSSFVNDSVAHGFLPVFSLYHLRETLPGAGMEEVAGFFANLENRDTMTSYLQDVRLFFQKAGETGQTSVLHVEPDLWGYIQRRGGAAETVQVATTGLSELAGLPNTAAGLAQAFVRLRDTYAPKVLLGYHLSVWGTGEDIALSDPSDERIDELAAASSAYYKALGAKFDLIFAEQSDRDAGYREVRDGDGGASFWTPEDFMRQARYLRGVSATTARSIVLWQLPVGNASQPNTPKHYKDNRVQTLLGSGGDAVRRAYVNAGVIGMLFGKALPDATCACDEDGDGQDDDGGLFKTLANAATAAGLEVLPGGPAKKPAKPVKTRTSAPVVAVKATVLAPRVGRGGNARVNVRLTARSTAQVVVAIQLYRPGAGTKPTYQVAFRGQRLRGGIPRTFKLSYAVPGGAQTGRWKVKVGLFDLNFKKLLVWRPAAAAFYVR